jgi:4-amino-4-deoxy-L-arabinose transferase-like glycosyltransferase
VFKRDRWIWWLALGALWLISWSADQSWLAADQRLPAWDQADYLNSAIDHGRALGLLPGGSWLGWQALLDLSPKIPPLASLISGSVMAISGEGADQASAVLGLWHGLLLLVVACWGRQLGGAGLGLTAAVLLALTPALTDLRVDFTLDLPVSACSSLALWRLGCWQRQGAAGGRWPQAIQAGLAIAAALLVKQSALLVLAAPALWCLGRSWNEPRRLRQALTALALVLALLLPWLHHNWISTLGGTNRAVVASGAAEGDPGSLDPRSLLWYPRLWPQQLGIVPLLAGISGWVLLAWPLRRIREALGRAGWPWLLGCCLSGWLLTSLSPNKDPRYIAPVLPLLVLLLTRGWWAIGEWVHDRCGRGWAGGLLGAGLLVSTCSTVGSRLGAIKHEPGSPAAAAIATLRREVGDQPTTLVMVASRASLNEQTLTFLGRSRGGRILARQLGRERRDHALALDQARWWLLASGDQGSQRAASRALSRRVRSDGRFEPVQSWPWDRGRRIELWRRRASAPAPEPLDPQFIRLARGLEQGPAALEPLFRRIGPWHLLDPSFSYQGRVRHWARERLRHEEGDRDALWSLALIAVLQNRPGQAAHWFTALEQRDGPGSWASAYRSVVLLADWNTCSAGRVAERALPASSGALASTLRALRDLGRSGCFDPRGPVALARSLPTAVQEIEAEIQQAERQQEKTQQADTHSSAINHGDGTRQP